MVLKGRSAKGSRNGNAKSTEKKVRQICAMKTKLAITNKEIAELFGMSVAAISNITAGRSWKHATNAV